MASTGRRPINAPPGSPQAAGVPWLGLSILLVLLLILGAFVAHFFFDVGKNESGSSTGTVAEADFGTTGESSVIAGHQGGALGFPAAATRNTTRISGNDPVDISIASALASYPTTGPGAPPAAVTIVDSTDWQSGVAAASLSALPVGAPILLAPSGTLSTAGADALAQLNPLGSPDTNSHRVFTVGAVAPPSGYEVERIDGASAAEIAAGVASQRAELVDGPPAAFVVVSSNSPEFATPAATWAARSGDVVLFTDKDEVPKATLDVLKDKSNKDVPIYVLGPSDVISSKAVKQLDKAGSTVERVGGDDAPTASVELVRFSSGLFGWNLNEPGHGYTLARADRPMDVVATTSLSTNGTWPALLLTDSAGELPQVIEDYLLDVKPGYTSDPTSAIFSHVWIIGDESLISVDQQARVDDAVELAPVDTLSEG
ncbi:MAG TPA: cell wall-binding repeat-containing protein [Solirubrobacterales bacterium]|nr:cell wall-binding repeat-containing protein [Solirubrobacterales bacterium]